ncbi:mannan endo-1,4-beta-mannosidase [Flavobacterium noncentrifugens]|uniref:Mannan endo-1,4-beta-mannosidase n=1 Tax=Flavobacterium noncentrifugens TaxID=1128970 RepID=A0A1G8WFW7_9FLAO|nr:glycosyl hydrolase [Flavobacterium noncentrifugens]GEP50917.1 mannan endo-1,4-beta-mannosidase [Flavobacterium noncentrifugens]SDJ77239.1 mannan endo-1,4-beta-mannosidase [Flavobacterium noncentrifugens]
MKKLSYFVLLVLFYGSGCSSEDQKPEENPTIAPEEESVLTPQNVRTYISDPNATDETVALFYNLIKLSKTGFAVGQQDAFNAFYQNNSGDSDIKKTTGNDPALLGSDFMFITDKNNTGEASNWFHQQEIIITNDVKEAYSKGMINIFCWHLREPNHEESFYASDMTDTEKATAFRSLLPGGANHDWFKLKLDKVALVLNALKDANNKSIPVIFRPFHEFDGSWFWWGANYCTPEEYKTAYRFTVDYLKNTKNVHNVLYAFSPDNSYATEANYLSRYPGDRYVDVLGMDNYGDLNNQGSAGAGRANAKLKILSDLANARIKIAALTETGYQVTVSNPVIPNWFSDYLYTTMTGNNINLAFVMFWNNSNNGYYVPTPSSSNAADFIQFANKQKSLLQNELPDLYHIGN